MSIYLLEPERGRVHFLYKLTGAGTRGLALLGAGPTARHAGAARHGFQPRSRVEAHRRASGRGVGLATLAPLGRGGAVGRDRYHRDPERAAARVADVGRYSSSPQGAATSSLYRQRTHQRPRECRAAAARTHRGRQGRCLFHLRLQPAHAVAAAPGRTEFGIPGQVALEQQMACGLGMCFCCVREFHVDRRRDRASPGLLEGPVFDLQEALSW